MEHYHQIIWTVSNTGGPHLSGRSLIGTITYRDDLTVDVVFWQNTVNVMLEHTSADFQI